MSRDPMREKVLKILSDRGYQYGKDYEVSGTVAVIKWNNRFVIAECCHFEALIAAPSLLACKPRENKVGKDRAAVCRMVSEMLDNPDEVKVYPTPMTYEEIEAFVNLERLKRGDLGRLVVDKNGNPITGTSNVAWRE